MFEHVFQKQWEFDFSHETYCFYSFTVPHPPIHRHAFCNIYTLSSVHRCICRGSLTQERIDSWCLLADTGKHPPLMSFESPLPGMNQVLTSLKPERAVVHL